MFFLLTKIIIYNLQQNLNHIIHKM